MTMRRLILAAILALLPVSTGAGTITLEIPTTPDHDYALAATVAGINANRAAETPPRDPITVTDYVRSLVQPALDSLATGHRDSVLGTAKDAFLAASPEQKVAVCAALGLAGKLPECP